MFTIALLFGVSASLDALLVGISYGIRRVRIRLWQNLAISLVTLLGTCLSVGLGQRLAAVLPSMIGKYAGSLVLIMLGLYYIAKWIKAHWQGIHARAVPNALQKAGVGHSGKTTPDQAPVASPRAVPQPDRTCPPETPPCGKPASLPKKAASQEAGLREQPRSPEPVPFLKLTEVLALSLTLSVNNLSAGFSASLAGLPMAPAAASTLICSVLFLFSGNRLGRSRWLQVAGCAAEPLSGLLLMGLGILQLLL